MQESESVLSARGLSKRFGEVDAVTDVSFDVDRGRVAGFLGPNGAGKTTTLRMLLGLARPTSGSAHVLGSPYTELKRPLKRVGVSVEADAFVAGRTGRNHMRCYADLAGCSTARIAELLDLVDLRGAADRAVGGYSTGMKRRLSIATALLGDPEILILDEPANGLDPDGIIWLRGLLRRFSEAGKTVLLSSHLLDEMQKIVDDVLLINRGRIIHAGPLDALLHSDACIVRAAMQQTDEVRRIFDDHGHDHFPLADGRIWVGASAQKVRTAIEGAGAAAPPVQVEPCTLESEFMRLTQSDREVSPL